MAVETKKFLDETGVKHILSRLDEYPDNKILGAVVDALNEAIVLKADKTYVDELIASIPTESDVLIVDCPDGSIISHSFEQIIAAVNNNKAVYASIYGTTMAPLTYVADDGSFIEFNSIRFKVDENQSSSAWIDSLKINSDNTFDIKYQKLATEEYVEENFVKPQYVTKAEYEALGDVVNSNGVHYYITDVDNEESTTNPLKWKVFASVKGHEQVDISSLVDIANEFMVIVKFMGSASTELQTTHIVPNVAGDIQRSVQGYFYMPSNGNLASATTGCIVVNINTISNVIFLSGDDAWTKVWDAGTQYTTEDATIGIYYR